MGKETLLVAVAGVIGLGIGFVFLNKTSDDDKYGIVKAVTVALILPMLTLLIGCTGMFAEPDQLPAEKQLANVSSNDISQDCIDVEGTKYCREINCIIVDGTKYCEDTNS